MAQPRPETSVSTCLLQIGTEIIPVYGDDQSGWSLESGIGMTRSPIYRTIDELFFALVNMNLSVEGNA